MTSSSDSKVNQCRGVVTQMYTFSSWSKQKAVQNSYTTSSMLPYVGFPGLSLTPIPESPLLDSMLGDDRDHGDRDRCLPGDGMEDPRHKSAKNGSNPRHWLNRGSERKALFAEEKGDVEAGGTHPEKGKPPNTCSVNVHVVHTTTFLPKDEPMTREEKRAHLCKLLLFAICGFVIVAAIVLWIFSPAFT